MTVKQVLSHFPTILSRPTGPTNQMFFTTIGDVKTHSHVQIQVSPPRTPYIKYMNSQHYLTFPTSTKYLLLSFKGQDFFQLLS